MDYLPHINNMYHQLYEYRGDFGDAIDWGPYKPIEVRQGESLRSEQLEGASVALLCLLASAIDNSTLVDAQSSYTRSVLDLLSNGRLFEEDSILNAVRIFARAESEEEFYSALARVYSDVVLPYIGENIDARQLHPQKPKLSEGIGNPICDS